MLTIDRSDEPQVATSLEAASDRVKRAVVAAGGHLESIQRTVLVVRQTQQQTAAINNDVDLVLLTSWPSLVQFERFKAELEGFSQHVSQGNNYNQMARIIPQVLSFSDSHSLADDFSLAAHSCRLSQLR